MDHANANISICEYTVYSSFRDSKLQVPVVKFDGSDNYFSGSLLSVCIPGLLYLGTSPKRVTPKRTPSVPTALPLKEEMRDEMKSLTLERLLWPVLHDSSTRNTMSACTTVLHAEGEKTWRNYLMYRK